MKEQQPLKPMPYSLLASMYSGWEEYKVPAVYYHYLLSILPKLDKKKQVMLMAKQVKSLKANTHPYHKIVNSIQARQKSLQIIKLNIEVFVDYQSTENMDWPHDNHHSNTLDFQFDYKQQPQSRYRIQHEDPRSPIQSPSLNPFSNQKHLRLQQLLNHIRLYQRLTVQIVLMIAEWQEELKQLGYINSVIQFQYRKQDYMEIINNDTLEILESYQNLFQNNPFLLIKRNHEKSEFALIYRELSLSQQMAQKIHKCLSIIAYHQADILRFRMLAKVGQSSNRKRQIIKSTDIGKIYMNYNKGQDYIMIKDSEAMKKSKIIQQPSLSRNKKLNLQQQNILTQEVEENDRIKSLKSSIIINPEVRLMAINKTVRKHPVQSNLINPNAHQKSRHEVYLKNPHDLAHSGVLNPPSSHEENRMDPIGPKRSRSMMLNFEGIANEKLKSNLTSSKFRERVSVKPVHGENHIMVEERRSIYRQDEMEKNKGIEMQKKFEAVNRINSELKLKNKSYAEIREYERSADKRQLAFREDMYRSQQRSKQVLQKRQQKQLTQLSQQSKITLVFEQNIKSNEIVKYLRAKVFANSPEVTFQETQSLAKKILAEKDQVTFIKVESRGLIVAWLMVKFLQKDNTMRRSVFIIYVRKFVRMSGFERKLLDSFVSHGYGQIRNEQRILYEIQLLDTVIRPLIKIKYKVNPTVTKEQVKLTMAKTATINKSRILKYHSYSRTSKYHSYCEHDKSFCMISYNFLELSKITVDKNKYIKAKADKISKLSQGVYRVNCVVNETDLIVANTFADISNLEKESEIEKDSSFDSQCETSFRYIALREGKVMRKYVNKEDQPIICQFISVNGTIPQVRSIALSKNDIKQDVLLLDPPYFLAIMTKAMGESKALAVLQFS